jgi:nitrate/TMAO reductase-like tetraheme cytochrome c subunit
MVATTLAIIAVIAIIALLVLVRFLRTPATGVARVFSVVAMIAIPGVWLMGMLAYSDSQMHKVSFCLKCHEMQPYGESLKVEDDESLPAAHYRNNRVPQEKACYVCHTNPGFLGYVDAKLRGVHDVRVHYFGKAPDQLELAAPFRNAVCLQCHGEAENFLKGMGHQFPKSLINDLRAEKTSCLECHDVAHILED